jgi:hypothetical protein
MNSQRPIVLQYLMAATMLAAFDSGAALAGREASSVVKRTGPAIANIFQPAETKLVLNEPRRIEFAQAGSTGGTIGRTGKSISGDEPERKRRATKSSTCNITGSWKWSTGGVAEIKPAGTVNKGKLRAKWSCSGNRVVLEWQHGYIDHLVLSDDAKSLSGKNNYGYKVHASRKSSD